MKTFTISALLATLVAIPFVLTRRHRVPVPVRQPGASLAENLRYDNSDLLT